MQFARPRRDARARWKSENRKWASAGQNSQLSLPLNGQTCFRKTWIGAAFRRRERESGDMAAIRLRSRKNTCDWIAECKEEWKSWTFAHVHWIIRRMNFRKFRGSKSDPRSNPGNRKFINDALDAEFGNPQFRLHGRPLLYSIESIPLNYSLWYTVYHTDLDLRSSNFDACPAMNSQLTKFVFTFLWNGFSHKKSGYWCNQKNLLT